MSTIALCIPAYNAANFLPKLFNSANEQNNQFNEILVYDDASADNTEEIAKKYGATVINGKINRGCAHGKNELAKVAKSEWLHFHDADDLLLPSFMNIAHRWINNSIAPDILLLHYHYINKENDQFLGEPNYDIDKLKEDPIKFNIVNKVVNFAIIRKSSFLKIGGFDNDPKVLYNEDRAFYTKAAISGLSFNYDPEPSCINYFYPKSMSSGNISKCADAQYHVWMKVISKTNNRYNTEIAHQLLENATFAAVAKNWEITKKSVKKAKELYPKILPKGSKFFKFIFRLFPYNSYLIREFIINNFTAKRIKEKDK